jgi:F-type H+-transporting ATPase subunit delta
VSSVAEHYARAVLELGVESGQLPRLVAELTSLADLYASSDDLRGVLDNPLVREAERTAVLSRVGSRLGLGRIALNTVRLLMQRRRLRLLPEISRDLARLADEKARVLRVTVISAVPLSDGYYRQLTTQLEQLTERSIILDKRQDPSLLGGVLTRIGDNTIDGSLKGRLEDLERQLLRA